MIEAFSSGFVTWPAASLRVSWDVVTSGDCSRVLHAGSLLWTPFSASSTCYYLNNQTVMLQKAVWACWVSWLLRDGRSETVLFWTGLFSVFFPCKIMFLKRLNKFQDLLGAHSKNLWFISLQVDLQSLWTSLFYSVSPCLSKAKGFYFVLKFQKGNNH